MYDFEKNKVDMFGTSYEEHYFKDGSFNRFSTYGWIKYKGSNEKIRLSDDWSIKKLKDLFDNYSTTKRNKEKKNSKDKIKKVTYWDCKVEIKNSIRIHDFNKALHSLKNKLIYYIPNSKHIFFYVWNDFFKDNNTNEYVYLDQTNQCFIKTGLIAGEGKVTKTILKNWITNYG